MASASPYSERTINNQINSASQTLITKAKLSKKSILCIKTDSALELNIFSILNPYLYRLKAACCRTVSFSEEQARAYAYKPKTLAYELYGNIELYSLILRLNHMKSISEFTQEKLVQGVIIPTTSVDDFLNEVLIKEKKQISRNGEEVQTEANTLASTTVNVL